MGIISLSDMMGLRFLCFTKALFYKGDIPPVSFKFFAKFVNPIENFGNFCVHPKARFGLLNI